MVLTALKPRHLALYRDIGRLLIRHGLVDTISLGRIDSAFMGDSVESDDDTRGPERLASDLEDLGPTFVKLGQLLSTRADLLPDPYLDALSRLQDDVKPVPPDEIEETIRSELGVELNEAFATFEREPFASASLGQVHRARLGNGREVAVKVLRPGIRSHVEEHLEAVLGIARLLDEHTDIGRRYAFAEMIEELQAMLLQELDYRKETQNLARMVESFSGNPQVVIPRPVERLCGSRVLTMDFIEGTKITKLTSLARTDIDGRLLAETLCKAYLQHMLIDGFFHADPHPGNVLLTPDGRVAMVDLGMVARLSSGFRSDLLKLMIGIADGDGDNVVDLCQTLGTPLDDYDEPRFKRKISRLVGRFSDSTVGQIPMGRLAFDLGRAGAECGLRPPAELALVGKTLLHLDEVGAVLDPRFDTNAVIRDHLPSIAGRRMLRGLNPRRAVATVFELNEFVQQLPRRLNTVLDSLTRRELEVRVHAFDESRMMASLQKIGSRITLGLLFSALIVGASLVMRIGTDRTLLGYPALPAILLLIGVLGSLLLALGIFLQDSRRKKH